MQLIGIARLGRDAELRHTANGDAVCSLSLAFNYGRKVQDGNKPKQWIEGSLWGKQAEALAQYLLKGKLVCVTIDDPHIEEFQKRDGGAGVKLTGRISALEFAGGGDSQQRQAPAAAPAPSQHQQAKQNGYAPAQSQNDYDMDIPF